MTRRIIRRHSEWRDGVLYAWHLLLECGHEATVYPLTAGEQIGDETECWVCGGGR